MLTMFKYAFMKIYAYKIYKNIWHKIIEHI